MDFENTVRLTLYEMKQACPYPVEADDFTLLCSIARTGRLLFAGTSSILSEDTGSDLRGGGARHRRYVHGE